MTATPASPEGSTGLSLPRRAPISSKAGSTVSLTFTPRACVICNSCTGFGTRSAIARHPNRSSGAEPFRQTTRGRATSTACCFGLERPGGGSEAWSVGRNDPKGYARERARLVDSIGADHVAIGTDLAGVGRNASVDGYQGVRRIVDHLQDLKLPDSVIERVACGNYARVLKAAMKG
jgi:hypothetical protein